MKISNFQLAKAEKAERQVWERRDDMLLVLFPACQVDGVPPSLTGAVLCIFAIGVKVSLARDSH